MRKISINQHRWTLKKGRLQEVENCRWRTYNLVIGEYLKVKVAAKEDPPGREGKMTIISYITYKYALK